MVFWRLLLQLGDCGLELLYIAGHLCLDCFLRDAF
jgi:hypothetical protein